MKISTILLFVAFIGDSIAGGQVISIADLKKDCESRGMTWNEWCLPTIFLSPELVKSITITECKPISGLTCKITLLEASKLPSRIFARVNESDINSSAKDIRLIYPNLEANNWSSGVVTFIGNDISSATELHLRGEWNGKHESAY